MLNLYQESVTSKVMEISHCCHKIALQALGRRSVGERPSMARAAAKTVLSVEGLLSAKSILALNRGERAGEVPSM